MQALHLNYLDVYVTGDQVKCLCSYSEYYTADTWAAIWIAAMTWGTMFPMCVYSGKILLQVNLLT